MIKVEEFITETFLTLTSQTYPYGTEDIIAKTMLDLGLFPDGMCKDTHGNYFYEIGESRTIFASHLDTVSSKVEPVTHVFDGNTIKTDGTTTLGADDKAGVTVMVWMMRNKIPGLYYFFIGEEVGCVGSKLVAKYEGFEGKYDRIISFDRRGTNSIITHQSWARCCSDEFADAFCDELNKSGMKYIKDDGGVYTDSAEFVDIIPECTNVSVGYYNEHSFNENQDIKHLVDLCNACLLVDWENLPTKRNPAVYEPKSYSNYGSCGGYTKKSKSKKSFNGSWSRNGSVSNKRSYGYHDDWYDEYSGYSYDDLSVESRYEEEEEWLHVANKRTNQNTKSKSKKSKGRTYLDNGGELIDLDKYKTKDRSYLWVSSKFENRSISSMELDVIKDQYLDIENNEYEKYYYECLKDEISLS